ncbi:MAG: hypothetical protein AAF267_23310 [Deinococcota bacterium]
MIPNEVAQKLLEHLPEHACELGIEHNLHRFNKMSVREHMELFDYDEDDFSSPEQHQKALEVDELWSLQWYPNTPVGFCITLAADFEALFEGGIPQELVKAFLGLLPKYEHKGRLELAHNPQRSFYESVERYFGSSKDLFVSAREYEQAVADDEAWEVFWSPNPGKGVTSHHLAASDLGVLLEQLSKPQYA